MGAEKGYELIRKAGFTAIDWNLDHSLKKMDINNGTYKGKCIFEKSINEVKYVMLKSWRLLRKINVFENVISN